MRKIIITLALIAWALLTVSVASGHPLQNYIVAAPEKAGPYSLNSEFCRELQFDRNFIYTDYCRVDIRTRNFKGENTIHQNYKFSLTHPMAVTAHTFGSDVMHVDLYLLKHTGNDMYELIYYSHGMDYEAQDKGWPMIDYEFYGSDFVGMSNIVNMYRVVGHGYLHEVLPEGEYLLVAEGAVRKMQTDIGRLNVTIRGVNVAENPVPWASRGQDPYLGYVLGDITPDSNFRTELEINNLWRVSNGPGVDLHSYFRVVNTEQDLNVIAIPMECVVNSISIYQGLGNVQTNQAGYGREVAYLPTNMPNDELAPVLKKAKGLQLGVYLMVINVSPKTQNAKISVDLFSRKRRPEPEPEPEPSTGANFEDAINLGSFKNDFSPAPVLITPDRFVLDTTGHKCIYHKFLLDRDINVEIDHEQSALPGSNIELYRDFHIHELYPEQHFLLKEDLGLWAGHRGKIKANLCPGTYYIKSSVHADEDKNLKIRIKGNIGEYAKTRLSLDQNRAYILSSKPIRDLPNSQWLDETGESVVTIQYYDGFGRPDQTVVQAMSPKGNDLVIHNEYDKAGRLSKSWLPVAKTLGKSGKYIDLDSLRLFADNLYGEKAYLGVGYQLSNFDRISNQYKPGDAWANKKQAFAYRFNQAAGELSCMRLDVMGIPSSHTLRANGFYAPGTLSVDEFDDEDGHRTLTFTNFYGQTLLVRQVLESGVYADTHSVYDDFGNLCYVLSPMGSAALAAGNTADALADYTFCYRYDNMNRCIEIKKPGVQPIRYIYDRKGQAILSQDGNLAVANQWAFTIPDKLGRPVLEGVCELVDVSQQMLSDSIVMATYDPLHPKSHSYRHNAPFTVDPYTILRVNYYDNYAHQKQLNNRFGPKHRVDINEISMPYTKGLDPEFNPIENTPRPFFGHLTGALNAVVDNPQKKVASSYYYNYEQHVVQSRSATHIGGLITLDIKYDFSGNVLISRECNYMPRQSGHDELLKRTSYNRNGAPVSQIISLNGSSPLLVRYAYDDLNRLVKKTYGENADTLTETCRYNIQNWLTHQNSRLFETELKYIDPNIPTTDGGTSVVPSYTGNITQWNWRHADPRNADLPLNSYALSYDAFSRLTDSHHFTRLNTSHTWTQPAVPMSEHNLQYDLNGNIHSLDRNGKSAGSPQTAITDQLGYEYQGNKLMALNHNNLSGNAETAGRYAYSYDANGNLVKDQRKGLEFEYNFLNLVKHVSNSRTRAEYTWLADGTKLAVTDNDGHGYLYLGSLIYREQADGAWTLEGANSNLGRIIASESSAGGVVGLKYTPYYQITDHLGSVRTVFTLSGNGPQVIAQNDYYPFGMRHENSLLAHGTDTENRFLFNGKESQVTGRLELLDYGARMYDPLTGRWFGLDPQSEKYSSLSPYAYCAGNPVKYTDDNGESIKDAIAGLVIGVTTNFSGDKSLRNSYTPDNAQHYNDALQVADIGSMIVGGAQTIAGGVAVLGGIGVGAGGTLITAGTAAPVAVSTGIAISSTGVLTVGTGIMLMSNASQNLGAKYEYGAQQENQAKRSNPKKEAREVGKEKRDNQKASENYAKYKAEKLEKAAGKGARRDAHDAKDKIGCDRTKKELDEDYKTIK